MKANQVDYFKTLFQVRRNMAAHLLDELGGPQSNPEIDQQKFKLRGRIEAWNEAIEELDSYTSLATAWHPKEPLRKALEDPAINKSEDIVN